LLSLGKKRLINALFPFNFVTLPSRSKTRGNIMSFIIFKQLNADAQEGSAANDATEPAATTNVPVDAPESVTTETSNAEVAAPEASKPVEIAPAVEERVATAHDDFDWSVDKRNVSSYNKEEKAKYDVVYDNTFKQINDGEMIKATIEAITKTDAVVNIGFKSDGLISLNEFRDVPGGLKVGDVIEVMVVEKEDRDGNLHLSRKQARTSRAWKGSLSYTKLVKLLPVSLRAKRKVA
jgi:small subunit ribosomal protein S1